MLHQIRPVSSVGDDHDIPSGLATKMPESSTRVDVTEEIPNDDLTQDNDDIINVVTSEQDTIVTQDIHTYTRPNIGTQ